MGSPEIPVDVKLIAAVTVQHSGQIDDIENFLKAQFGEIDARSEIFPFSYTNYYEEEMGPDLSKMFYSFKKLIKRNKLPSIKLLTNQYEQSRAENGRRIVNVDPGYICEANLILATTKNFSHRIYLEDGIFGDCHLIYEDDEFKPLAWTYADYKTPETLAFLKLARKSYYGQLQDQKSGKTIKTVTYADAGVDIDEGNKAVQRIKKMVKRTYGKNVLSELGKFGGFYAPDWKEFEEPVLVSSVDGVGTKLKIAFETGIHNSVGRCLVNHCINDILCCGAKPLFFLDYLAFGKLEVDVFEGVVSGLAGACEDAGCALIGGETAEMPGCYKEGEYDISGAIVGITGKDKVLDGKKIEAGDVLIGLPSTGLHTNGYSLARKVFFEIAGLKADSKLPELDRTVGEELLRVHKCYYNEVYPLIQKDFINGLAHITGGGLTGNISRLLSNKLLLDINWESWKRLPVFDVIHNLGNVAEEEMRQAFNLGIGMVIIAKDEFSGEIIDSLKNDGIEALKIGSIKNG
jgi:phosphoribosylformylglycinamidine cyclo-ligase